MTIEGFADALAGYHDVADRLHQYLLSHATVQYDPRLDARDVLDVDVELLVDLLDRAGIRVDGIPETDR